jgi:Base plate wedge protein 53
MQLFTLYPQIDYKFDTYNTKRAIDITTSIKVKELIKSYRGILSRPYVVQNGERPDQVSFKFYGTTDYDWAIMMVNDMYSIYDDWPKSSVALNNYIIEKYGSVNNATGSSRYYNQYGDEIDLTTYNTLNSNQRTSETLYEYEVRKNFNKSKIKIILPELISSIDSQIKSNLNISIR